MKHTNEHKKIAGVVLVGIFFLVLVSAGTITDISSYLDIPDFVAGGNTTTTFSFKYLDLPKNYNNAPLVARVNISSLEENCPLPSGDCSVWKGDFSLFMYAEQYLLPGFFKYRTIPMPCYEDAPIQFKAKDRPDIQYTIDEIPNGTFYCYNPNYYMLQLNSKTEATLNISSESALYPGEYNVSVELLEMEPDDSPPEITLLLDKFIFNESQTIPIKLNVTDLYPIKIVEYKITNPDITSYYNSGWIEAQLNESSGLYEHTFVFSEYNLTESGSYLIFARACDVLGNCGDM